MTREDADRLAERLNTREAERMARIEAENPELAKVTKRRRYEPAETHTAVSVGGWYVRMLRD